MRNKEIVKQMIDLQKKSFYNCFSTMVMLQDQAEKLLKNFVDHIPGMSDEVKKVMEQWNSAYKKSRDDFMKAVDDGYNKVELFFVYNNAMVILQDQTEKFLKNFVDHIPGMSDEGKKVIDQWNSAYKKSHDDFMKAVDDGYAKVESFLYYYNAMVMFQDQTKGIFKNWIPQDFKKTMEEMTAMHKKNRDEFKKFIDENIHHLQDLFPFANKPQTKTK